MREIELAGQAIGYRLRRAKRRSIGFVIGAEGLSVNAPTWLSLADIEAALRGKSAWIVRKLVEQRERQQQRQSTAVEWRDGTVIPYLGAPLVIVLDRRVARTAGAAVRVGESPGRHGSEDRGTDLPPALQPAVAGASTSTATATATAPPRLHVALPPTASADLISRAVQRWLQQQARRIFQQRCAHFAPQLGVHCTRLSLSSARTRWGSASASGAIRLNWRLVHLDLPTIDYVVVHELAHLREMNHSPRFWAVVRSAMPGFELARRRLKEAVLPVFDAA